MYIYPNSGTIPTSNPIISDAHETQRTHMEASWDWGVNNTAALFLIGTYYILVYINVLYGILYNGIYLIISYYVLLIFIVFY